MLDPTTGQQTEINERAGGVQRVELFKDKLTYLARGAAIVVFAGSLPREVEPDLYATLVRELDRVQVMTVVDTDGEPLRQAVRAEPDLVSPNVLEAEELVGHEFASEDERSHALAEIAALGPREAIMTLPDGCLAQLTIDGHRVVKRAHVEHREPIGKVGSGDAFLAGYLAGRYEGRAPRPVPASRGGVRAESTAPGWARPDRLARGAAHDGRRRAVAGGAPGRGRLAPPRAHRLTPAVAAGGYPPATSRRRNTR